VHRSVEVGHGALNVRQPVFQDLFDAPIDVGTEA
jgi:hypothetical protein